MQIKKQISGWLKGCAAAFSLVLATSAIGATDVTTYFHNDVSGTPMLATDAAGQVVWKEAYRPYGQKLTNAAASANNKVGFAGKPFDNNTGLSYMGARYYDPLLGRFTGIDPKEVDPSDLHSFNRYAYANNNPYKYVDLDGHSPLDVAFLMYDLGKLGLAMYSGVGVGAAAADVALSAIGVASPFPGVGQAMKAARTAERAVEVGRGAEKAAEVATATKELHRPYIRKGTRSEVEAAAPRDAVGRPIDPNTGRAIEGRPDLGHKPGNEFWREKQKAEAEGLTQKHFNDRMNDSTKYQLESPSSNRSRRYEQKD